MCGELECDRLLTFAHADPIETSYLPSAPRGAMACGVARVKGAAEDRAIAVRAKSTGDVATLCGAVRGVAGSQLWRCKLAAKERAMACRRCTGW